MSSTTSMAAPGSENFNPHLQPITIFYPDATNFTLTLMDITQVNYAAIRKVTIFGAELGASIIILVLLAALTWAEKRRTILFSVNMLALLALAIRSILQIEYYLQPWFDMYTYLSGDTSDVSMGSRATTVAAGTMQIVLVAATQISLILQIRVVYASMPKINIAMTALASVVATTVMSFYTISLVQSNIAGMRAEPYLGGWIYPTARGLYAFSICLYSLVFVLKLGHAIHRRKCLGLQKFGPLQVVFIMGCQTMLVPGKNSHCPWRNFLCLSLLTLAAAIFSVVENVVKFDGLSSLTAALVAISLPLSAMWAAAQTETPSPSGMGDSYQRIFRSNDARSGGGISTQRLPSHRPMAMHVNSHSSAGSASPTMVEKKMGVHVKKSFEVKNSPVPVTPKSMDEVV